MTLVVSQTLPAPQVLIAFDPGKTTGWSIFLDGKPESLGQTGIEEMPGKLAEFADTYKGKKVVVVYENFKLFRGRAIQQSGSDMEASQIVGQVKMIAAQNKWEIYDQPPNIKPIAQKWSGAVPPSNHAISHQVDAYNHGYYWLVKNGMVRINGT